MKRYDKIEERVYQLSNETYDDCLAAARHLSADSARLKLLVEKLRNKPMQFHEVSEIMQRLNGVYIHSLELLDVYSTIQYYLLLLNDIKK